MAGYLSLTVFILTLYVLQRDPSRLAEAKHIKSQLMKVGHTNMNEVSPDGKAQPNLFDLLMSALSDTEMMEEEEAARRKQMETLQGQSGTKPCYWSLVSCYKRRRK